MCLKGFGLLVLVNYCQTFMSNHLTKKYGCRNLIRLLPFTLVALFLLRAGSALGIGMAELIIIHRSAIPSLINSSAESPEFVIHPVSQTECYYRTVTFFAKATGENLKYVWERKLPGQEFIIIPIGDNKVSYPSSGSITIRDVGTAANPDGTEFRAIVSDGTSSVVSQSATLTINRITGVLASTNPANATQIQQCAGSDFSWTVVTNYPENVVGYQWMKYYGPNDWRPVFDDDCISGSQTERLQFNGIRTDCSGRYYVSIRFRSSADAGCTVSSQSSFNRQIEVYDPQNLELTCPVPEPFYLPDQSGFYSGDFYADAFSECGPLKLIYYIEDEEINFPYLFGIGSTIVTVVAPALPGLGNLCQYEVVVGDPQPPTFIVPDQPFRFCQSFPEHVVYDEFGIKIDPEHDQVILKGTELALFDLDPDTYFWEDDLCPQDDLILHWSIEFSAVADPLNPGQVKQAESIFGLGQPSASSLEICIPGSAPGNGWTEHTINYWLVDCHGMKSDIKSVSILVYSRPGIVLSTGYP